MGERMTCKKCLSDRSITEFYKLRSGNRDKVCKECRIKQVNERRLRIKEIEEEAEKHIKGILRIE